MLDEETTAHCCEQKDVRIQTLKGAMISWMAEAGLDKWSRPVKNDPSLHQALAETALHSTGDAEKGWQLFHLKQLGMTKAMRDTFKLSLTESSISLRCNSGQPPVGKRIIVDELIYSTWPHVSSLGWKGGPWLEGRGVLKQGQNKCRPDWKTTWRWSGTVLDTSHSRSTPVGTAWLTAYSMTNRNNLKQNVK